MVDITQIWGIVVAIAIVILILGIAVGVRISDTGNIQRYCRYLQERRTTDSLAIEHLRNQLWRKQLLYSDTLFIETTIVDESIVKQRYRNGDSVLKVW